MNNNGYQSWQDPYSNYPNGQGQYPQNGRQPMVVIPQLSPAELQQYHHTPDRYVSPQTFQPQPHQQHQQRQQHIYSPVYAPPIQYHSPHQSYSNQLLSYPDSSQFQQNPQSRSFQPGYQQMHSGSPPIPRQQLPIPAQISNAHNHQMNRSPVDNPAIMRPQAMSQHRQQATASPRPSQSMQQASKQDTPRQRRSSALGIQTPVSSSATKPSRQSSQHVKSQQRTSPAASSKPQPSRQQQPSAAPSPAILHQQVRSKSSQNQTVTTPQLETASTMSTSAQQNQDSIDYQVVILSLAEEYFSSARAMGKGVALNGSADDVEQYYQLIANGLGCLETVLKHWRFSDPRAEARLRLKYANLLFEETENEAEAQATITKALTLCERSRLVDLKNSMHHLLIRIQFRSNPRAAFKMIDSLVPDLEAYQQTHWIYAIRFLRVSLSLQLSATPDSSNVLANLRAITTLAESYRHIPVLTMSCALEAMMHLRAAGTESGELAQRALATARSHQLDPTLQSCPQLTAFVDMLDLVSDLIAHKAESAAPKLQAMQAKMDACSKDSHWRCDGVFRLPTGVPTPLELDGDATGIMHRDSAGQCCLVFDWMTQSEFYSLGYILSGVATLQKNTVDERAQKFLLEGVKLTEESFALNERIDQSLNTISVHLESRRTMRYMLQVCLAFALCIRCRWSSAQEIVDEIRETLTLRSTKAPMHLVTYLEGVIAQGTGNHEAALLCFQSPDLTLPTLPTKITGSNLDIRILASMNAICIMQQSQKSQQEAQELLTKVLAFSKHHNNSDIVSAVNFTASIDSAIPIVQMKSFLSIALTSAKETGNHHLIAVIMNVMVVRFFTNIVGEQAEKSAHVGVKLARKAHNPLWSAVSHENLAKCMDLHGKRDKAVEARGIAQEMMEKVPEAIRRDFAQ